VRTLADQIENYLKKLLSSNETGILELRRADLAEIFMCVPSQISYVLETRFTSDQGYHVESRRGGGGYVRIIRLSTNQSEELNKAIQSMSGQQVSQQAGYGLIDRLQEEKFLSKREAILVKSLIDNAVLKDCCKGAELLRSHMLQMVLINILRQDFEEEGK